MLRNWVYYPTLLYRANVNKDLFLVYLTTLSELPSSYSVE